MGLYYNDTDFIGFSFGGVHSDTLKIIRTSNGSRYDLPLNAQIKDSVVEVLQGDGQMFFSSQFTTKTYNVEFAFDNLEEVDIRRLQQVFNGKEVKELIFDEEPYKVYEAKVTGTPALKTICFEERGRPRVYKGTGTVGFTCYCPYAHTPKGEEGDEIDGKYLQYYDDIPNRCEEWKQHCKLLDANKSYNYINTGELPAPYIVTLTGSVKANDYVVIAGNKITFKEDCTNVEWNSKTGLVVGEVGGTKRAVHFIGQSIHRLPVGNSNTIAYSLTDGATFTIDYQFWYY